MTENLELREWIAVNVMGVRKAHDGAWVMPRVVDSEGAETAGAQWALPAYEITWDAAALVVEAMAKLGLATRYAEELGKIVPGACAGELRWSGVARMLLATPMQQCLAAKAAIEGTR